MKSQLVSMKPLVLTMKVLLLVTSLGLALAVDEFIVGGDDVTQAGKWPWQGSLRKNGRHICGLSLISSDWGVTAAHCVHGQAGASLSFMFGSNKKSDNTVVVKAKKIIQHESYDIGEGSFPNDIAVIQFAKPVSGANIAAVPLTTKGAEHAGNKDCWITGWGYKIYGSTPPEILQEAHINVYTKEVCLEDRPTSINDGHVCIGDTVNGRTSCNGDSGGPLVCKVNGRYELVGATSFGTQGCKTDDPAVYTRMAYFRDWIKTKTGL